jgi:hypothetical protein
MLFGRYASRASEAKYPSLWRGLVGSWAPSITGPTGTRLFDLSGRNNHGTLTNTTASAAWRSHRGRYLIDFPTSANEYVACANPRVGGLSRMALSYWLMRTGNNSGASGNGIIGLWQLQGAGSANQFVSLFSANAVAFVLVAGTQVSVVALQSIALGTLYHVACIYTGTTLQIYVDGVLGGSAALSGAIAAGSGPLWLGSYSGIEQSICSLNDVRIYNRALSPAEIRLLAQRPGIAYEPRQRRYFDSAAFNRRRRLLTGAA